MSADDGLAALEAALQATSAKLNGEALQAICQSALQPMLADAQRRAPVATGDLRSHIVIVGHHDEHRASAAVQVEQSGPGEPEHKAIYAEFGTSKEPARPFLRPAFHAHQESAAAAIESAIRDLLAAT